MGQQFRDKTPAIAPEQTILYRTVKGKGSQNEDYSAISCYIYRGIWKNAHERGE